MYMSKPFQTRDSSTTQPFFPGILPPNLTDISRGILKKECHHHRLPLLTPSDHGRRILQRNDLASPMRAKNVSWKDIVRFLVFLPLMATLSLGCVNLGI